MRRWAFIIIVWASSWAVNVQGGTSCGGTTLDWYSNVVGETPCDTYQRLRQICNPSYTVGTLSTSTPGDRCDEQVADCCCNSVSFALSMLCLNCQQGVGSGVNGDTGYDAGKGAYQQYLSGGDGNSCNPNVNQSLPTGIQAAVCNNKIKIYDDLYTLFWSAGDWFYEYTRQTISKDQAELFDNTFTHCASTTVSDSSSSSSSSSSDGATTVSSSSPSSTSPIAAPAPGSISQSSSSTSSTSPGSSSTSSGSSSTSPGSPSTSPGSSSTSPGSSSTPRISSSTTPASSSTTLASSASSHSSSLSGGAIAGIATGAAVLLVVGVILWFLRSRRKQTFKPAYDAVRPEVDDPAAAFRVEPFPPSQSPSSNIYPTQNSHTSSTTSSQNLIIHKPPIQSRPEPSQTQVEPSTSLSPLPERHIDAGAAMLERSPSGRLPPAYGEQLDAVM